jgi:hypothetical protein
MELCTMMKSCVTLFSMDENLMDERLVTLSSMDENLYKPLLSG